MLQSTGPWPCVRGRSTLLCTQKHRTLPVRLRQALFVLLKAQNAARLLGAAHPGPRLDFIRRGRGGKAGGTKLAVLPVSCGFPLARATRKIRVAKFWKFQVSSLLNFHIRRLEVHNLWDLVDLSVAPINPAFATTAKTLEGLLIFKAVILRFSLLQHSHFRALLNSTF